MTEVLFYHLERSTLAQVLPALLVRTIERGQRALVRCGTPEGLEEIDGHLWTFRDESFLPHGRAGEDHEAAQPVLLTLGEAAPNEAKVLFLVEGAPVSAEAMASFARAVVMFDAEGAPDAREAWRAVKGAGLDATYWKQTPQGRWEKAG
ncbi:DNA polymerase III subunit chi [Parvularcula dongshanensis]|uniref:DNA polymerase-3 subunit chi n=1 Tax=Parvularcula dongshanensis TaxID=1173995 RepID=A0A840I586_9PROT|nr:DNA polymerase-3 subunit chi [Parvularcula dongshanensis]